MLTFKEANTTKLQWSHIPNGRLGMLMSIQQDKIYDYNYTSVQARRRTTYAFKGTLHQCELLAVFLDSLPRVRLVMFNAGTNEVTLVEFVCILSSLLYCGGLARCYAVLSSPF